VLRLRWSLVAATAIAFVILPAFLIFEFSNFQRDYYGFKVGLLPLDSGLMQERMHLVLLKADALLIDCKEVPRDELAIYMKSLLKAEAHPVLLLDADPRLSVQETVGFIDEVNGILPGTKVVLVTARTDPKPCGYPVQ
jgi:hypothetical protein